MRCQKCQYVGFEPSPRCKNCGYDFSLGNDDHESLQLDDAPMLTLETEPAHDGAMADFDLQIFDDIPAKRVQGGAKPFDLDDLLANGPASGSLSGSSYRDAEPVIAPVSAVAKRRQSASASQTASAVATPPPMEVEALFKPAPAVAAITVEESRLEVEPAQSFVPEPVIAKPAPAPVTTELPLFMQVMSDVAEPAAPIVHAPVPASVEAAADAAGDLAIEASHAVGSAYAVASAQEIDDRPLVQMPSTPRAPLAVRRTTPDPARLRAKYARAGARLKSGDVGTSGDLLNDVREFDADAESRTLPPAQRLSAEPTPTSLPAEWIQGVGPAKRLAAAAVDSALLLSLDAAVIWFTLTVCGLSTSQANLLPVAPLLLFFLLLDAGYLVLFTAACGQTIGKMAAGIRVVGTTTGAVINDRITIAQAVMRSLGSIVSMLPLGAGFWFGLVGDRRAAHDRLAHTRVVSA